MKDINIEDAINLFYNFLKSDNVRSKLITIYAGVYYHYGLILLKTGVPVFEIWIICGEIKLNYPDSKYLFEGKLSPQAWDKMKHDYENREIQGLSIEKIKELL